MAETKIEWCDYTFSAWWGCAKVSPACDHCYAEAWAKRTGHRNLWGVDAQRRLMGEKYWDQPYKWNSQAEASGVRRRVFVNSMADTFDNHEAVVTAREWLWQLIASTPHLDWLVLTKRIGNAPRMLPPDWGKDGYPNVWLGISVGDQKEAERDVPKLLEIPARVRFLSCEPLLSPMTLFDFNPTGGALRGPAVIIDQGMTPSTPDSPPEGYDNSYPGIDWVIVGAESGPGARPVNLLWIRDLMIQCNAANVPVFVKQLGSVWAKENGGDRKGGDPSRWPQELRIRQWPASEARPRFDAVVNV